MSLKLCPFCVQVNPTSARFCSACGMTLVDSGATGDDADRDEGADTVRDDLNLTLRALDEVSEHLADDPDEPRTHKPAAATGAAPARSPARARHGAELPPAGLIQSDPVVDEAEQAASARSVAKAARRALVRRALLATAAQQPGAGAGPSDVLVMDNDDGDRRQLCSLLEGFGFEVLATQHVGQVEALLGVHAFTAVFLAIVLDGSPDGAATRVCGLVKRAPSQTINASPALIIVAESARSVDRVRAALVGAGAFLQKPLKRGDVVRALEDCDVLLPLDARRA